MDARFTVSFRSFAHGRFKQPVEEGDLTVLVHESVAPHMRPTIAILIAEKWLRANDPLFTHSDARVLDVTPA